MSFCRASGSPGQREGGGREEVCVRGGLAGSLEQDLSRDVQREEAAGSVLTAGPGPALACFSHPGV